MTLVGIDSAHAPMDLRRTLWEKLAGEWKPDCLEKLGHECTLAGLSAEIDLILQVRQRGRAVVVL